jgi:hypothetical protein
MIFYKLMKYHSWFELIVTCNFKHSAVKNCRLLIKLQYSFTIETQQKIIHISRMYNYKRVNIFYIFCLNWIYIKCKIYW